MRPEKAPLRMCFSNHDLGRPECQTCQDVNSCLDTQAGYGMSTALDSLSRNIEAEAAQRELPDWVFELDAKIVTDEDLETLKADCPELYRAYMKFNEIPEG